MIALLAFLCRMVAKPFLSESGDDEYTVLITTTL